MAAFEPIRSGFEQMDLALDAIRLGDNVVWQVSSLTEFRVIARRFAQQAIRDGRNLIYIRFAGHDPILSEMEGLRICKIPLSHRFETFTVEIHNLIEREGYDAFYVFDCLSELEEAWATDLMMGDFFHLTCPYLFSLDTVAYFPLIRGRHSFEAVNKIRETTQLFLDVLPVEDGARLMYVRPLKVWGRETEEMLRPHLFDPDTGGFAPETGGVEMSHYYRQMNRRSAGMNPNMDSWERFFARTRIKYENGLDVGPECSRICDIMLTRDERLRELIKQVFTPEDYFEIHDRMIGTGMIGGKACGMLLSRKLVEHCRPEIFPRIEPHDSWYIGSDVFYTFIVDNGFWDLRVKQRTAEGYFALAGESAQKFVEGTFSKEIEEEFLRILEYYGNTPVIVRSSSILEDGFGNAFAGKYDSVFCAGTGSLAERLRVFEDAVRTVYASSMSLSALDYRKRRGLDARDEQMAILVQRVSGSLYEDCFLPCAAGVGYSLSPYRFSADHPDGGMLRLVMGLGTAAVDRRTGSYPRMVMLEDPDRVLLTSSAERHQFSQRLIDAVSLKSGEVEGVSPESIRKKLPAYLTRMLLSHDWDTERELRERGMDREILYVSCEGVVKNRSVMEDMKQILELLQECYQNPVDIEYTINIAPDGEYVIDLLQCRPLSLTREGDRIEVPEAAPERIILETVKVSMGFSRSFAADVVVVIDPIRYYQMPYRDKPMARDVLSAVNWKLRGMHKKMVLLTPGRICTSSPELGVPSAFSDISEFDLIGEVSETEAGYLPELSYGSHIFQDLVEAEILYTAVFQDGSTLQYHPELLSVFPDELACYTSHAEQLSGIIHVYGTDGKVMLFYDMSQEHLMLSLR